MKNKVGGWKETFGCNIHALAIFRITLGFMLLLELLLRFRFLHPFYSDEGTLPRYILLPQIDNIYNTLCLHCVFGSLNAQRILLSIQCLFAFTLAIGYHTRLSSIVSWFLYLSLTLRNTWLNFILDRYFHYLLFYSIFLPALDQIWSVDAYLQRQQQTSQKEQINTTSVATKTIVNPATIALKLQILWIYIDAGYGKYADPLQGWSFHADPLPALDTYVRHTLAARYLYSLLGPFGLRLLTPTVVYAEMGCPIVALIGSWLGWYKVVTSSVALICSMHVGIAFTIRNTILLSLVACVAWAVYLPPSLFPQEEEHRQQENTKNNEKEEKQQTKNNNLFSFIVIATFVGGSIWFETVAKQCDQSMEHVWSTLLHNRWNVFVGAEEYVTWEIAPGKLADGSVVDIWSKSETINWNMPGTGAPCTSTSRPGRWRSYPYLAELEGEEGQVLWDYLCYEWDNEHGVLLKNGTIDNDNGGKKLLRFNFFMLQADVLPEMWFSSTRKRLIHSHVCPGVEISEGNDNAGGGEREYSFLTEEL